MEKAKPRPVNWTSDEDLKAAIMGAMGFSTKFISEETGLTPCQIGYRLNKASIKRASYRNGQNEMAQRVIERAMPGRSRDIRETLNLKTKTESKNAS